MNLHISAASLACLLAASPASATPEPVNHCAMRAAILERLERSYDETLHASGLASGGGLIEITVAPEGGWTILITYPKQPTCVLAVGKAWHDQPPVVAGAPT